MNWYIDELEKLRRSYVAAKKFNLEHGPCSARVTRERLDGCAKNSDEIIHPGIAALAQGILVTLNTDDILCSSKVVL